MAGDHDSNFGMVVPERGPGHGSLLSDISTSVVGIRRRHYGRGAMHAKTYLNDDLIVVVTRANGLTPFERTLVDRGDPDRVIAIRKQFLDLMADRYKQTVEQLTGRRVLAFLYEVSLEPDITIETFVLDQPLDMAEPTALRAAAEQQRRTNDLDVGFGQLESGTGAQRLSRNTTGSACQER